MEMLFGGLLSLVAITMGKKKKKTLIEECNVEHFYRFVDVVLSQIKSDDRRISKHRGLCKFVAAAERHPVC